MYWRAARKGLQTIHLWTGLILALPMIVIGLTGSALLVQREVLALSVPGATASGEPQSISAIVAAAKRAAPVGMTAKRIELPGSISSASAVRFTPAKADRPEIDIYVDPVSLKILGQQDVVDRGPILALLIETHAFLQMPPQYGLPFVGFVGVVMTFMGVTGLILWWPKKGQWMRAFFIRRGARGLTLHLDLHHSAGIWGLFALVFVSVSGIYLTFPEVIGPFIRDTFPVEDVTAMPLPGYVPDKGPIGPERAVALAETAVPNARATSLEFGDADKPYVIELEALGWSPSAPPVMVVMDRKSSEVSYIEDPRGYTLRDKAIDWQHLIHFGIGLGLMWKLMVFFSGLLPTVLAVTGATIWWKRRRIPRPA